MTGLPFRKRYGIPAWATARTISRHYGAWPAWPRGFLGGSAARRENEREGGLSQLHLTLLGAPRAERDGAAVRFDTRKAMALLAVLAVSGRAWSREELAALLWPESDSARARGSLRRTLVSASAVGDALVAERSQVRVDASRTSCDVLRFRELAAGIDRSSREAAVALWTGDFLAGFSLRDSPEFEDWSDETRSTLRAELDTVLARLVAELSDVGDFATATRYAQQRLSLDRLHEPAHQLLMQTLASAGQRPGALQQYRQCVAVLDRELGVAPLPETTALYEAIRRNEYPPAARQSAKVAPKRREPKRGRAGHLTVAVDAEPFVGRTVELDALDSAWRSLHETSAVVAVVGETGTGKTRLVAEFVARGSVGPVVRVRGHEGERRLALAAAADLVRSALSVPDMHAGLADQDRNRLSALVPDVAGDGQTPSALDTPGALTRLFDSVRTLLTPSTGDGRLVVWCEDVEWFDDESVDLLTFLLLRPPPGSLFVVSWRTADHRASVVEAVGDALRAGNGQLLRLGALDKAEVADLLTALGAPAPPDVESVLLRTGGVPLLVVEHVLAADEPDSGSPTGRRNVDAVVGARLDGAPDTTMQVLSTIGVLANPADPALLQLVSGRSESEVADALDDALRRRLLTAGPTGLDYDFPHDGLRRAVIDRTAVARRRLLHSRAADVLAQRRERHPHSAAAATVGRQLELAGRSDEAALMYLAAADDARRLYAHATAVAQLESAVALGADPATTHRALGDARLHLGQYSAAVEDYEIAVSIAADVAASVGAEHKLAEVFHRQGEWELALDHLQAALAHSLGADEAQQRAGILSDVALVNLRLGRPDDAAAAASEAMTLAEQAADAAARAQAANVLAVLAVRRGEPAEALGLLAVAQACAQELEDPGPLVAVLNNRARIEADQGELDTAIVTAERALALGERHGDRHRLAALHANLADLLHLAGREEESRAHVVASVSMFAEVDREPDRRPEVWKLVEW